MSSRDDGGDAALGGHCSDANQHVTAESSTPPSPTAAPLWAPGTLEHHRATADVPDSPRARHRKTSSLTSPPPPPADFNPPADFAPEVALYGIGTPSGSSSSSPWSTIQQQLQLGSEDIHSPLSLPSADGAQVDKSFRPQMDPLHRLSNDSGHHGSKHSSRSSSTAGSDSGSDVLAARRGELVSHLLADTAALSTQSTGDSGFEYFVTGATPRGSSAGLADYLAMTASTAAVAAATDRHQSPPPRPRSFSSSGRVADDAVHAWDSVWPAPNSGHRSHAVGMSRFPMAPMSPYVTPSFSPSVVQTTRRMSSSPPRPPSSPRLHGVDSDRPGSSKEQGRPSPTLARSQSHTVASTTSPRLNPVSSTPPPQSLGSPASPIESVWKPPLASSSVLPTQPQTSPAPPTPPPTHNTGRPRADRSIASQFPELVPPFISHNERTHSSSRISRRRSETAITRSPHASCNNDGLAMSAVITPSALPLSVDSRLDTVPTLLPPPTSRPEGPRRARSAQDPLSGPLSLSSLCPGSPNNTSLIEPHRQIPSLDPPFDPTSVQHNFAPLVYPMDDSALESDDDDQLEAFESSAQTSRALSSTSTEAAFTAAGLVDEGDLLPTYTQAPVIDADVTFDDEGLTTLERIFLLSRSEYSFHRAYVARVLGELLGDVDPCESAEYVLPLVSGFSLDEDETVKEAFAADLHRILWYFFSTCELVPGEEPPTREQYLSEPSDDEPNSSLPESVAHLENALRTPPIEVPRERLDQMFAAQTASSSASQGESSTDWSTQATTNVETLGLRSEPHSMDSFESAHMVPTLDSGPVFVKGDGDEDKWLTSTVENVDPPVLAVDFFRPLLGTLLLSNNPAVADPVRTGITATIARLRGHGDVSPKIWGSTWDQPDVERKKTFLSQTGPHCHVLKPFSQAARTLVEMELLHGIVLGMGTLSTDVPDSLFDNSVEVVGDGNSEYEVDRVRDEELFREQMVHEATLGRALSLSFIGSVCELYTEAEVEHFGFIEEIVRGLDGDAATRAEAALAMSFVAKTAPNDAILRFLPVFNAFAHDEEDQVRQSACVCLPTLCKRIEDTESRILFAVNTMDVFMASTENVRFAALEALGEVIYTFSSDPQGPPRALLDIYTDDSGVEDQDSDWDVVASFNFPGVCLTLGSERWPELRGLFERMVARAGDRVFRTVAAFLHELAQILTPEQVAEDVVPVYRKCLRLGDDIRVRIFEHIDVLVASLPTELGWFSFRRLSDAWNDDELGGWRAREQLALHIPSFLSTFREHSEVGLVLEMMRSALLDPFAAVRDAATFAVPRSYEILQGSQCSAETFYDMLLDLSHSPRYRQRLTFVRCLREFMRPPPNKSAFEEFFVPTLGRLAEDVVDVRLALALALADLFIVGAFYGDGAVPVPHQIRDVVLTLSHDEAVDVRNALTAVGADRWASWQENTPDTALEALVEAKGESKNPDGIQNAVEEALSTEAIDGAQVNALHDRARVASPLQMDDDESDLLSLTSTDDPFEVSFARAASVRTSIISLSSSRSSDVDKSEWERAIGRTASIPLSPPEPSPPDLELEDEASTPVNQLYQ